MSRDIALLLIGAAIALGSSIVTALAQHLLSLRAERIKRGWEKEERESEEFKKGLIVGSQVQLDLVRKKMGVGVFKYPADIHSGHVSEADLRELFGEHASEVEDKEG